MKYLIAIFLLIFSFETIAQVPEPVLISLKGYGGSDDDQINTHVTKTQDGGFIISLVSFSDTSTGNLDSFCVMGGYRTIYLKYNADASVLEWSKCYENTGDSAIEFIFPVNDGGYILGGQFSGGGFLICKEDAVGNVVWSHSYSQEFNGPGLSDMIATDDGGFIMVGESAITDTNVLIHYGSLGNPDIWALKVDSNGNKVWSTVIGGTYGAEPFSVMPGPHGGCYIFGATNSGDYDCTGLHEVSGGPYPDAYLVRLDSSGHILWHHDLGGSGSDGEHGWGIADGKGGVLLANGSNSVDGDVHHHIGGYDYWVLDVDSSNNILWDNSYGGLSPTVFPYAVCKAVDGSIWIAGASNGQGGAVDTNYGHSDAWIVHADSVGNFINAKVIGGNNQDEGLMIYPLSGGSVITGGYYSGLGGNAPANYYGLFDAFIATLAPWTTGIENIKNDDSPFIYPNPASEKLNIQLQQFTRNIHLKIFDEIGVMVYDDIFTSGLMTLDVSKWYQGIYLVQMISADGSKITKKLLKE